jgi:hypothetical protein
MERRESRTADERKYFTRKIRNHVHRSRSAAVKVTANRRDRRVARQSLRQEA